MAHDGKRFVASLRRFGVRAAPQARRFAVASGRGIVSGSKETLSQLSTGLNREQAQRLKSLENKEISVEGLTKTETKTLRLLRERRARFITDRNRLLKKYHPFSILGRAAFKRVRA